MKKPSWNERLFWWIVEKVFRHPSHMIFPQHLIALRWALCPISMLTWWMARNWIFYYDISRDIFTIYGMKYAGSLFRSLAKNGLNVGAWMRIVKREDGIISLGTVSPRIQAEFDRLLEQQKEA